jgi:hypothetical protein
MNPWLWVPIGLGLWLLTGLLVGLIVGRIMRLGASDLSE